MQASLLGAKELEVGVKRVMSDNRCNYGYIPRGRTRPSYHDNILQYITLPLNNTMNMIGTQKLEVVLKGGMLKQPPQQIAMANSVYTHNLPPKQHGRKLVNALLNISADIRI